MTDLRHSRSFSFIRVVALMVFIVPAGATDAQNRAVGRTVHNLAAGPGAARVLGGSNRVCIHCHNSHSAQGSVPLWNREMTDTIYRVYRSSTLDARPGQPTGSSKLCLSCHDGTIALGQSLSGAQLSKIRSGGHRPSGLANLGTDLSDDHPISFPYTAGLAAADRQLRSPAQLPREVKLGRWSHLQCTSCHDAHDNQHGDFLVRPHRRGFLCLACHDMHGWTGSSHATSTAAVQPGTWPYATVAENACRSCHRMHFAGGRERLRIHELEEENCLGCHDGTVARTDIRTELNKTSSHDPRLHVGRHDPVETNPGANPHVECSDCHNPHAVMRPGLGGGTGYVAIGRTMKGVRGVNSGGAQIMEARYEYEVCFRCHADSAVNVTRQVRRQFQTSNLRLKFSPENMSYHPVVTTSPSRDTVSLVSDVSRGSLLRCTDCHNNDASPRAGGQGPDGPHGSAYPYLLVRNYSVIDNTQESASEYALCYKCHRRSSILGDESFPFHRLHVVDSSTPCSVCHDPHGVSSSTGAGMSSLTHLINFDTTVVQREQTTGRLQFRDFGRFSGSCTLVCHGVSHVDTQYRK